MGATDPDQGDLTCFYLLGMNSPLFTGTEELNTHWLEEKLSSRYIPYLSTPVMVIHCPVHVVDAGWTTEHCWRFSLVFFPSVYKILNPPWG